jgi:hypothetical protein
MALVLIPGALRKGQTVSTLGCHIAGWAIFAVVAMGWATEEELVIVPRAADAPIVGPMTSAIRLLGGDEARQDERSEALRTIAKATDPAGDKVVNHLDAQKYGDWSVRRGAVRCLQALGLAGPRVSSALAWTAARDGEPKVRDEAISVIKTRGDWAATELLGRHLMDTFDRKGLVLHAEVHDQTVGALRTIGDRRVAEAMLTYVTVEVRTSLTQLSGMRSRHMRAAVPQGDGTIGGVDLPMEFPEIGMTKERTTLMVPALAALRSLTGQDFGDDQDQWRRWIRSHPVGDWK